MRRSLASRIIVLAVIYCAVFCILVILQFSRGGSFAINAGEMTIRGRYLHDSQLSSYELDFLSGEFPQTEVNPVSGGIKIFYAGLEFNLSEERGKGFLLKDSNGADIPVNPEIMLMSGETVHFILPTGTIIAFSYSDTLRGPQLQISAQFAENISEAVIPIIPRRSSIVSDAGQLGIMYSGSRYAFSNPGRELENWLLVLTSENPSISYVTRSRQRAFDPSDFIIAAEQNYEGRVRSWQDSFYARYNQNRSLLSNEDDVTAFLSQSLQRGSYTAALNAIPAGFAGSQANGFKSAAYVGGMAAAYRQFVAAETEKINLITRLARENPLDLFYEDHILDFLFSRNYSALANDIINIVAGVQAHEITASHIPGLFEIYQDVRQGNPIAHLTEQMLLIISENLVRTEDSGLVFVKDSQDINALYSMRLGLGLIHWAEAEGHSEWASVGKSLVLSAIQGGDDGKLYGVLRPAEYYPRAALLTNEGHWAWTIAQSISASTIDGDINLAFTFPVNMTHHVIIRGVRQFVSIQIHGQAWRTDSQFEIYDSSGWVYYPGEQILVLKLRHREALENVRLIYRAPAPAPVITPPVETPPAVPETPGEPDEAPYSYYY